MHIFSICYYLRSWSQYRRRTRSLTSPIGSITRSYRRRRCSTQRSTPGVSRRRVAGHHNACAACLASAVSYRSGDGGADEREENSDFQFHLYRGRRVWVSGFCIRGLGLSQLGFYQEGRHEVGLTVPRLTPWVEFGLVDW